MGLLALFCFVVLVLVVPSEVWGVLFKAGLILAIAFVGWWAFMFWAMGL